MKALIECLMCGKTWEVDCIDRWGEGINYETVEDYLRSIGVRCPHCKSGWYQTVEEQEYERVKNNPGIARNMYYIKDKD